jgi:hypothetical protein
MNDLRRRLESRGWILPAFFFLLAVLLAYAPLLPFLGFYWDDWPVIYQIDNHTDFWSFYAYGRLFSAWTYVLTSPILGVRPLGWHLFSLMLRWLVTLGLWWNLTLLWPRRRREAIWIGLIFAVHPAFTLQPIAVAFSQHLLTYLLFLVSTGAMLQAVRKPGQSRIMTALALLTQVLHMLTMEYLWGLELLRPLMLWLVLPGSCNKRLKAAGNKWAPYLAVFLMAAIWRVFLLELPGEDPNALVLLESIRTNPLGGLLEALTRVIQDTFHMLLLTWTEDLEINNGITSDRFFIISWGWAILAGAITYLLLRRVRKVEGDTVPPGFYKSALGIGAPALLLALVPIWVTGNQVTAGLYGSRFSLPAIFGGSIILIGLMDYFLRGRRQKVLVMSILVGLAVGAHLRNANEFRWDWQEQAAFFWQLTWRAPGLQDGTALFSDGAVFRFTGGYPTSAALNTIYPQQRAYPEQSFWFFELDNTYWREMQAFTEGVNLKGSLRNLVFTGTSLEGLTLIYEPDSGSCLMLLSPPDTLLPVLPELTAEAAVVSDVSRIEPSSTPDLVTMKAIFGPEPAPDWCTYFQKASLALQTGDYESVLEFEDRVLQAGLAPNNLFEWFPFIEAHARLGDWEAATGQLLEAFANSKKTRDRPAFCAFWSRLGGESIDALACDPLP